MKKVFLLCIVICLCFSMLGCKNTANVNENRSGKDIIEISSSIAEMEKEYILGYAEIIIRGKITKKLSEVMINPDGTRKTDLGDIATNEQITEYEVEILDLYKGDYTDSKINVKTSNGKGLTPDLILHGEDDTSVLSAPLDRFDLDVGQECILLIRNRNEFGREGIDEALGYVVLFGQTGYFLPDGNGNYVCNAGKDINCFTLDPDTIIDEIASANTADTQL